MTEPSLTGGPWRMLVLDTSDPDDPRWIIATVSPTPGEVRPAAMGGRRYQDWPEVTEWVRAETGAARVSLVTVAVAVWRVDEGDPR